MSFDQVTSSFRGRPELSSTLKKEILWNIIEPGDPYDIKRSMIAKLPGDERNFMGEHMDIVCLFQAAEIQRLCEYLEDYKLKYREIQRRELDRHSYEIQIKELTQQLAGESSHKSENLKLKDFLKKQTIELQELRKKTSSNQSLEVKYENALRQIEGLMQEKNQARVQNGNLGMEINKLIAQISAVESAKHREIEDLRFTLTSQSNANFERDKREIIMKYENEIGRLDFELKRLKEINQAKNREIEEAQARNGKIQAQLQEEISKNQHYTILQNNLKDYEKRFVLFSEEIERLNNVLRKKANECDQLTGKNRIIDEQFRRKSQEFEDVLQRNRKQEERMMELANSLSESQYKINQLSESQKIVVQYQEKIEQLSLEIERLNGVLKKQVNQNSQIQRKLSEVEYQYRKIDVMRRENEQLRKNLNESNRKLGEYENKITILSQEIQRLNTNLRIKVDQVNSYEQKGRGYIQQIQTLKRKNSEYEYSITQQWQTKVTRFTQQNDELRRRLQELGDVNRKVAEYQNRIALLSQQLERLNDVIKRLSAENEEMRMKIIESQEVSRKNIEFESIIRQLQQDNERLGQSSRRVSEYELRISQYGNEMERLNNALKLKLEDITSLEGKLRSSQGENESLRRKNSEFQYTITQEWQAKVTRFTQENDELRRRLQELGEVNKKVTEYENRIVMLSQELERVNGNLRVKVQECSNWQAKNRALQQEVDSLKRKNSDFEYSITQEWQVKVTRFTQENEDLKRRIQELTETNRRASQENDELRRRIQELGDVNRKVAEYQNRIALLSQELERLNMNLKSKIEENSSLEARVRSMQQEIDSLNRKNNEYEFKITQEWQMKVSSFEQKITYYAQENEDLRKRLQELGETNRKVSEYEGRITLLGQQIQRLNEILRRLNTENEDMRQKLVEFQEVSRKNIEFESIVRTLKQDNDRLGDASRKVGEYQLRISQYGSELERLNNALRSKVDEGNDLQSNITRLNQQNDELRRRLQELGDVNRKVAEYQNRIALLSQELERLNMTLSTKSEQNRIQESKLRSFLQEFEDSKIKSSQKEYSITQEWQSKLFILSQQNQDLRSKGSELSSAHKKINQYENRLTLLSQEIERLNGHLRTKVDEVSNLQKANRQLIQDVETLRRKNSEFQFNISQEWQGKVARLTQENEELKFRLQELDQVNKKVASYESRITLLSQELQRLNVNLKGKSEEKDNLQNRYRNLSTEVDELRRKNSEYEFTMKRYDRDFEDLNKKIKVFSEVNLKISRQNDELKVRLQELNDVNRKLAEYENKIAILSQQIERLNGNLKIKFEQLNNNEKKCRNLEIENEALKRKNSDFEYSITQEWQVKVTRFTQENEDLKRRIQELTETNRRASQENDELRRRIQELGDVNRKVAEYQNRIALLSQELERLNMNLKSKIEENSSLEARVRSMQQEIDSLNRKNNEYEFKITQEWQMKVSSFEQKITYYAQENEDLRKRLQELGETNRKVSEYEGRITLLGQQIQRLNEILRRLNTENEDMRQKLVEFQEVSRKNIEFESIVRTLKQDNDRLGDASRKVGEYQLRISQYGSELERLNNALRSKVDEGNDLQSNITRLNQQNDELRRRLQELGDVNRKVAEYQNRIALLSQQLERLNDVIKRLSAENEEMRMKIIESQEVSRKNIEFESIIRQLQQDNERLGQSSRRVSEYELRISQYGNEMERLNNALKLKLEDITSLEGKLRSSQGENESLRRKNSEFQYTITQEWQAKVTRFTQENDELRRRLQELGEVNKKVTEYENRIVMLSQELERVNGNLRVKVQECSNWQAKNRALQQEVDSLKRKNSDFEYSITQEWQVKVTRFTQENEDLKRRIQELTETNRRASQENDELRRRIQELGDVNRKVAEYQNRITLLSQELERSNGVIQIKLEEFTSSENKLRSLQQQNDNLKRRNAEFQQSITQEWQLKATRFTQENDDLQRRIQELSQINRRATQQNEELRSRLQELSDMNRKLSEYENKIALLSQQIERLNMNLRSKVDENSNLENRIRTLQQEVEVLRKKNSEYQYTITQEWQVKLTRFAQENEDLRRKAQELNESKLRVSDYQNKFSSLSSEIERLNHVLKLKVEENNEYESRLKKSYLEVQQLRRRLQDFDEANKLISKYESKIAILSQEVERLNIVLRDSTGQNNKYLSEIERLNNTLRLKVQQSLRFEINHRELATRLQREEENNQALSQDYNGLKSTHGMLSSQYESSKKHLLEYEQSIKKLYSEFERLQSIMQDLKKENYNLSMKLRESQGLVDKNRVLSAQIDRLTEIIEFQKEEIAELRIRMSDEVALQKRINEHMALMVVLFAEIEALRKRVRDKEKEVEDVRRSSLAPFKV